MQLTLPCEYSVKEILPAVRALIAEKLVAENNVSIYKTAELMGLTPAAVENYIKKRRGNAIKDVLKKDKKFMEMIEGFIRIILSKNGKDGASISSYYCMLCAEGKRVLIKQGYQMSHCIVETLSSTYDFSLEKAFK